MFVSICCCFCKVFGFGQVFLSNAPTEAIGVDLHLNVFNMASFFVGRFNQKLDASEYFSNNLQLI